MSLYEQALARYKRNRELRLNGVHLNIPYPYQRLDDILCGIDKGQAIGILGPTGSGKSKWTRFTFLYSVYRFYKQTGYKVKVLWFCLEDAKELTFDFVVCHYLKELYDIKISHKQINSYGRGEHAEVPEFVLEKLEEAIEYFKELEDVVSFIDGETEPTRLYDICRAIALNPKMGTVKDWVEDVEGKKVKQYRYDSDVHVIAVFDNMSNIDSEEGTSNEQAAILKFVKEYMRLKLCNFFKWTCVMVMQLDFESERQAFTKNGDNIMAKIEPGLASIGDSKRSSRSFHIIFSLFSPHRYELLHYPVPSRHDPENCYRIDILKDNFRSLRVLKSNHNMPGNRVGLFFDGMTETFEELPLPKTLELKSVYESLTGSKYISQKINSKFNSIIDEDDSEDAF